jgi:hypothetical protein
MTAVGRGRWANGARTRPIVMELVVTVRFTEDQK